MRNTFLAIGSFCGLAFGAMALAEAPDNRAAPCLANYIFANNIGGIDAPVFDASGNRLSGSNYLALLYGGPTADSLSVAWNENGLPMSPVPFTATLGGQAGYFYNGAVFVPDVPAYTYAWLQVRAWDARIAPSWEEAVTLGLGGYGESDVFRRLGGNACSLPPVAPSPLFGLRSFSLVPEPSPLALSLLGGRVAGWAALCQRRRKRL